MVAGVQTEPRNVGVRATADLRFLEKNAVADAGTSLLFVEFELCWQVDKEEGVIGADEGGQLRQRGVTGLLGEDLCRRRKEVYVVGFRGQQLLQRLLVEIGVARLRGWRRLNRLHALESQEKGVIGLE